VKFAYHLDKKITEVLAENNFTLSAEVVPPRNGAEEDVVLDNIERLHLAGADFLAVTKGAGGSLRGGTLPISQSIKEFLGIPCIAHFTCRDLTPKEVENSLMDHHYFAIRNILALRGDPPMDNPNRVAKEGSYKYAHELISHIKNLNQGIYLSRPEERSTAPRHPTDFCIGAAAYPDQSIKGKNFEYFQQKVEAGAEFAITQMLFNPENYAEFMELCAKNKLDIPIIPGTKILQSQTQAHLMCTRFGVGISQTYLNALPEKKADSYDQALTAFYALIERLRELGAPGVHLFVLSDIEVAFQAIKHMHAEYA
jgi:methylenetetrahydrofolate reductase (NADPH)